MLELRPCDFQTARDFVGEHHRHNKPPVGHKFSIACYDGERLCGVAMVGRPIGRYLTDEMLSELYDWCGKSDSEENMRLVSMGEIRGMTQLANALKEVLKV